MASVGLSVSASPPFALSQSDTKTDLCDWASSGGLFDETGFTSFPGSINMLKSTFFVINVLV